MFKKISSLVLGLVVVLGLAACADSVGQVEGYYVSVDINPSIEFMVDGDDNVVSYLFLNDDAEILCADLDFNGMNVDDAVELFVQTATEAGYIDPEGDDNAVLLTVIGDEEDEEQVKTIRERIRTRVIRHLAKRYINGVVLSEEFTQEDLVAEAEALEVSPGKLKLSYAAMAIDETLVLEELLEMPVKDIMAIVRELHEDEWKDYKEERIQEMRELKAEKIAEHKAVIDQIKEDNSELTEEEIQALIEEYKQEVREEYKEKWQERVQKWRERREARQQEREENNEEDDQTT